MHAPKRLTKEERRAQLLACARDVVRAQGTDALTLAVVAERAGVTKPIAYEHFGTRIGLLAALAEQLSDEYTEAVRQAVEGTPPRLEPLVRVVADTTMRCFSMDGAEWQAVAAALNGTSEMAAQVDRGVTLLCEIFGKVVKLPREELRLRCVSIGGAVDALVREIVLRRITQASAARQIRTVMLAVLS